MGARRCAGDDPGGGSSMIDWTALGDETVDPFGGAIADGYLYGRGAIDMKSTGIPHLAALLALKRARVPLKRDLVFLATADEEAGSEFGAQFIANRHRDWLAGAEYAI